MIPMASSYDRMILLGPVVLVVVVVSSDPFPLGKEGPFFPENGRIAGELKLLAKASPKRRRIEDARFMVVGDS